MSTDLHKRMLAFEYGEGERSDLMRDVWAPTPWMVNVFTCGGRDVRDHQILNWCFDRFGPESSPIHAAKGSWHRGNATVMGWTWFGFASEPDMIAFIEAWPSPATAEDAA